ALTINYISPFILTREFLGSITRNRGAVLFINSTVALMPKEHVSAYAASKAALKSFADVLYEEVSSLGVQVSSIYPGRVATPMQKTVCDIEGSEYDPRKFISPKTIAQQVIRILTLPENAEIRDLTIRQPRRK
ncbi:MAG: SDR family NAD(P)-dependent oxidoreductase, partial [Bacteroidales bacterium]|nr:SDR family NAD(P)-dependent oxidoreductase [Bacteroidales bacterium]